MNTKQLRQKILDLAIRGKLVPQDPNDEPASALLKQIKSTQTTQIKQKNTDKKISENQSNLCHQCAPFEIPENWEWCKLENVFQITMGQSPVGSSVTTNNQGVEFHQGKLCFGEKYLEISNYYTDNPTRVAESNSLLLCVRAPVGIVNITSRKICIGRGLCAIRVPEMMDILFAFYWLKTLENTFNQKASGSTFAAISGDIIKNELIPLPPLSEQRRIVSVIESAFVLIDEIEANKLSLAQLIKQTKSKVLDLAIRGKLVSQDPNDEPASALLRQIIKSTQTTQIKQKNTDKKISENQSNQCHQCASFEIPESWEWCRLGDLCDYGTCKSVKISEIQNDNWILDLEDIEKDTGKLLQRVKKADKATTSVRHSFVAGNVLYSKLRTYLNKVLVADMVGFCSTEIIPLDFKGFVVPEYARHVLMSQMFLDYTAQCGYGVKMPRLGTIDGKKALFPLPPLSEQHRIVQKIETIFEALDIIQSNL